MDNIERLDICMIGAGNVGNPHCKQLRLHTPHNLHIYDKKPNVDLPWDLETGLMGTGGDVVRLNYDDGVPEGMDIYWVNVDLDTNDPTSYGRFQALMGEIISRMSDTSTIICSTSMIIGDGDNYRKMMNGKGTYIYLPEHYNSDHSYDANSMKPLYAGIAEEDREVAIGVLSSLNVPAISEVSVVDIRTAEFVKHAENARRALDVVWHNMLFDIASIEGVSCHQLQESLTRIALAKPINPEPMRASIGYGGKCLVNSVAQLTRRNSPMNELLSATWMANHHRIMTIAESIKKHWLQAREHHQGIPVMLIIYGVTFKRNSPSLLYSPAMTILGSILNWCEGMHVYVVDPYIERGTSDPFLYGRIISPEEANAPNMKALRVQLVAHGTFADYPMDATYAF